MGWFKQNEYKTFHRRENALNLILLVLGHYLYQQKNISTIRLVIKPYFKISLLFLTFISSSLKTNLKAKR